MNPTYGFLGFLALTLAALAVTVVSGHRAKLRVHLPFVALSVAFLGTTIYFAERLGELYDLESAGLIMPVHLALAKIATGSYLLPVVTGIMTLRNRRHRRLHLLAAIVVLVFTVAAAATGAWMVFAAEPLAPR